MAVNFLAHEVSDICLGKPSLKPISLTATLSDVITALQLTRETFLSIWICDMKESGADTGHVDSCCRCVGKVCMVDVICFLCEDENLKSPSSALKSPVSALIRKLPTRIVQHLQSNSSLLDAIDLILEGAQNLVVPIHIRSCRRRKLQLASIHNLHVPREYCWLTQEDVIRFLLNSISAFSPTPALSIQTLGIIDTVQGLTVPHHASSSSTLVPKIALSLTQQTAIAVLDDQQKILGEISPLTIALCDPTVAGAISTLSAGDLMAYIERGLTPLDDLVSLVKSRLRSRKYVGMVEMMEEDCWEFGSGRNARGSETVVCYPWSSLVAVMIQALVHRVNYLWVVEEDCRLVGIVTFAGMLKILREHIRVMG